jgi:hypothetical protein
MLGLVTIELIIVILCLVIPAFLVGMSPRVTDKRKYIWILLSLFLSWFGYLLFILLTDKPQEDVSVVD